MEGSLNNLNSLGLPIEDQMNQIEKKIEMHLVMRQKAVDMSKKFDSKAAKESAANEIKTIDERLSFFKSEIRRLKNLQRAGEVVQDEQPSNGSRRVSESSKISSELANARKASGSMNNLTPTQEPIITDNAIAGLSKDDVVDTCRVINNINRRSSLGVGLTNEKIEYKMNELQYKIEVEARIRDGAARLIDSIHSDDRRKEAESSLNFSKAKINLLKNSLKNYESLLITSSRNDKDSNEGTGVTINPVEKVSGKLTIKVFEMKHPNRDGYCAILVDNLQKLKTKIRSKTTVNEELSIKLENASEVEIAYFDKNDALLSLLFFKLGPISKASEYLKGVKDEFEMETTGTIHLYIQFENFVEKKRQADKLGRVKVVKRKQQHIVYGHKFSNVRLSVPAVCAICREFLMTGYQCDSCMYLCHKKCHQKTLNKCISEANAEDDLSPDDMRRKITFNVPHRFEKTSVMTPTSCCHCGYMLPLARKNIYKCNLCNSFCHEGCKQFIPNFCGLKPEMLDLMFSPLSRVKNNVVAGSSTDISVAKSLDNLKIVTENHAKTSHSNQTSFLSRLMGFSGSKSEIGKSRSRSSSDLLRNTTGKRTCINDFNFLSVLGKGYFGKVMLVEEKKTGKLFAIKLLKKDFIIENEEIESVKSEKQIFQIASKERHPFLVNMHSCFQTDTRMCFVMEYVSGGDLMLHIQRQHFTYERARFYAAEVLLALEYLHKNNIVYRDLKLDNILLSLDGHIKLADYGLCKQNMSYDTRTGTFCGTPEFMAPEILDEHNYNGYTRSVDWWAFGVLIYEMLFGMAPFQGDSEDEIFEAIKRGVFHFPSVVDPSALDIMSKLMNKDSKKRLGASPADAQEIKKHPYFFGVDWEDMLQLKIKPPFIPSIQSKTDVGNFDEEFTSEPPILTPIPSILHEADQEDFKGFSFTSEWV